MKPSLDQRLSLSVLRRMSSAERLQAAFELSEFTKALFRAGLRRRFPDRSQAELQQLMLDRLFRCRNRTS